MADEVHALGASTKSMDDTALASAFASLLKDHSQLGLRLKEIPFDWNTEHHRLYGKFFYITFIDGVPSVQDFVEYLYDCLLPYCLPKKLLQKVVPDSSAPLDLSRIVRLGDETKGLFIKAKSQLDSGGEPGELILYALLEWALKAPRLVSKMYLKTNANMPVHGTDGIHLGFDPASEMMTIYFGESKIYQSFSSAAQAAFSSIGELITNSEQISREIAILNNMSDLDALDSAFREKVLEYIDPYSSSASSLMRRTVHACLLGFEYAAYKKLLVLPPDIVAARFEAQYKKRIAGICCVIERHYSKTLPPTINLHMFLLPFPSVQDFRKAFYLKLGVTE